MLGTIWVAPGQGDTWAVLEWAMGTTLELPAEVRDTREQSRLVLTGEPICACDHLRLAAAYREAASDDSRSAVWLRGD